ncbi:hypothetical protein D3C71_1595450 [compost metagenome]
MKLFDQYFEGFRHARFWHVLAFDNRLVGLNPAHHVIRFNGQNFLKGISGTISFKRPYLHLTETLSTKLSFTTQRLLRNKRVRTRGTSMDLIVNHVSEFDHVHDTNSDFTFEFVTRTTIIQHSLTVTLHTRFFHGVEYVILFGAIKYWSCYVDTQVHSRHTQMDFKHLSDVHP